MGIQGTEVAKESSDIIILDDNFASVVKVGLSVHVFLFYFFRSYFFNFIRIIPAVMCLIDITYIAFETWSMDVLLRHEF